MRPPKRGVEITTIKVRLARVHLVLDPPRSVLLWQQGKRLTLSLKGLGPGGVAQLMLYPASIKAASFTCFDG